MFVDFNHGFITTGWAQTEPTKLLNSRIQTTQRATVIKPKNSQAQTVALHPNKNVVVDFSKITNEKITLISKDDQLIIVFGDGSSTKLTSFFDSSGKPRTNVKILLGSSLNMSATEFAKLFLITTDQTILPAAGPADLETIRSAYWNSWFERGGDILTNHALEVGKRYKFVLDLSMHDYVLFWAGRAGIQSTKADPALQEFLSKTDVNQIGLVIRPIIPEGSGLRFAEPNGTLNLPVNLDRLRKEDIDANEQLKSNKISFIDYSARVAAGRVEFDVIADEPGCSAIVLSIWSENGRIPLDHLVRGISIVVDGSPPEPCNDLRVESQRSMRGGLKTLLETSLALSSGSTIQAAAAAFHVFDTKAGNFAVFVDGRPGQMKNVYSWQTLSKLTDYLLTQDLADMMRIARIAAVGGQSGSYVPVAQQLAKKLFTGRGKASIAEAKNASNAFKEIVVESTERPVVVAKIVSESTVNDQNRSFFLPLGILAAKGNNAFLAKPITVVQPLPRERYASKDSCVKNWTFGIPNELEGVGTLPKALSQERPGNQTMFERWLRTLSDLKSYLSDDKVPDAKAAQGFLLLAHQSNGDLWFDKNEPHIIREDIKRNFPSGSVAIFAACSAAGPQGDNAALLKDFNERGIDAFVASPFPTSAAYGSQLALEFADIISEKRQIGNAITFADLFARAQQQTADRLAKGNNGQYEEIGLEYVLLGDPNIRLCN